MRKRKEPPYLLTVLTGPNAGAELGLSGARKTLGGNSKQDIQLDGLPGEALRFMMEKERLTIRPDRGVEVTTRDGTVLKPKRSTELPLPTQVTINGTVTLHVCRLYQEKGFLARRLPIFAAAAAMIAVFGFGFSTLLSTTGLATASVAPQPLCAMVEAAPAPEPVKPKRCGPDCVTAAAEAFAGYAKEAGLEDVTVTPSGDILRVQTRGIAQGDPRWASVRTAYDRDWAARVPILVERARPVPKAPFAVQSVWLGSPAEVTTRDGAVYKVGSIVPGGWTIDAIQSGSIDLSLGPDRIRIEF